MENSNLTPAQQKLVRTPAFKAWFGDWENSPETASKVVDENGEPLVVWHGTRKKGINVFDYSKSKKDVVWDAKYPTNAIFFTTSKNMARFYGNIVKPYFLKGINPDHYSSKIVDEYNLQYATKVSAEYPFTNYDWSGSAEVFIDHNYFVYENRKGDSIRADGYDDKYDSVFEPKASKDNVIQRSVFVVFNPTQIKLADGTNTTFDYNPDIRYADGGVVKELYHYTSEINFDRIFDSNILNPSQKYGNRLSFTSDSEYHKKEHGLDYGNTNVRITFDNEKLISDGYSFSPFDHSSKQNKIEKEFEYIISIPIKNVKKYIKNITIFKGNAIVDEIDKTATDYANKYYFNSDIKFADGGSLNSFQQLANRYNNGK